MTLGRAEITEGLSNELESFKQLIEGLDVQAWRTATRCEGWTVADVAAHVIGSMSDAVNGRVEGLGSPEVTAREVEERRGRSAAELAQELAQVQKLSADLSAAFDDSGWDTPAPGGYEGTLGQGIEALWYDTYLHADDIRAALGLPSQKGEGLRASVHHVAFELSKLNWGPATLALEGMEEVRVGPGGKNISGDPLKFVLTATGRLNPASFGPDAPLDIYAD